VLHELTDAGGTVLVIEHNMEVITTADRIWIWAGGGDGGGHIVRTWHE
jgi:excinuclease ABC subunit A